MKTNLHEAVQNAIERLDTAGPEMVLDLSSVDRVEPGALHELAGLAGQAHDKSVKIVLGGVNIDVYKVLKLMKIEHRFLFQ